MPSLRIFIACLAPVVPWVFLELWLALNVDYSTLLDTGVPYDASVRIAVAVENFLIRYVYGVFLLASFNPLVELGIIWWNGAFGRKAAESFDSRRDTRRLFSWLTVTAFCGVLGVLTILTKIGPWPSVYSLGFWAATVAYSLCLAAVYFAERHRAWSGQSNWHPGWVLGAGLLLPFLWPFLFPVVPLLTLARGLRRNVAAVGA